jgi:hypothetical protein
MTMTAWLTTITIRLADGGPAAVLTPGQRGRLAVSTATDPWVYRRLTGKRHPEISRMHHMYRQRRGRRW